MHSGTFADVRVFDGWPINCSSCLDLGPSCLDLVRVAWAVFELPDPSCLLHVLVRDLGNDGCVFGGALGGCGVAL